MLLRYLQMKNSFLVTLFCLLTIGCNSGQISKNEDSTNEGLTFNETYVSMEEAEEKLIAALSSHYPDENSYYIYRMPNDELIDFLLKESNALNYDFPKLRKTDFIDDIVTSDDGNLRFYYWDTGMGGTMIDWGDVCQFRYGKTIKTLNGNVLNFEANDESKEIDGDWNPGCAVSDIYTITTKDSKKIYLVKTYIRESSGWGYRGITAVKIEDGSLKPANIFSVDGESTYAIGVEYSIPDWFFRANVKQGWDWVISFNSATNTLYIPEEDGSMTDRYTLYKFDGEKMNAIGVDGGYWLHPSLRQFENLEFIYTTKDYTIRVDKMGENSYRYSSWSKGRGISENPDIVIYNGYNNDTSNAIEFLNNGYLYKVTEGGLGIYKNGRKIMNQLKETPEYDD